MLEKLPHVVGEALSGIRPGLDRTVFHAPDFASVPDTIRVTSPAFADGEPMPVAYTDDGDGTSPPLAWSGVPGGAASLVVLVEDADSPTPAPLVHAIVYGLPGRDGDLPEGALDEDEEGAPAKPAMGKNSFRGVEWLPPDPPPGHGPHRYLFQVYALDRVPVLDGSPGRGAVLEAMRGHVLARGALLATFERP